MKGSVILPNLFYLLAVVIALLVVSSDFLLAQKPDDVEQRVML